MVLQMGDQAAVWICARYFAVVRIAACVICTLVLPATVVSTGVRESCVFYFCKYSQASRITAVGRERARPSANVLLPQPGAPLTRIKRDALISIMRRYSVAFVDDGPGDVAARNHPVPTNKRNTDAVPAYPQQYGGYRDVVGHESIHGLDLQSPHSR